MADHDGANERLKRKQQFYSDMSKLVDNEDDDAPDPGRQSSIQAMRKAALIRRTPGTSKLRGSNSLARSVSDSKVIEQRKQDGAGGPAADVRPTSSSEAQTAAPSATTRQTFSGKPSETMGTETAPAAKATGKRKRSNEPKQLPDDQQIFKGLQFYFFPNNDTNPARKMRITKALEFGAAWRKQFSDTVSHVVVDKALDYKQLLKFLKRDSFPEHVVVVSENYPAECISFRTLLNPCQLQFKVKAHDMIPTTRPSSSSSDKSLHLKTAGKAVTVRQPETPPAERTVSPVASSVGADKDVEPVTSAGTDDRVESTDAFDAAIRKARELHDVPLDTDDEPASRPTSSEGPDTDDNEQSKELTFLKKKKTKYQRFQDKFQCMQKHTGEKTETANAATIAVLQQMADYYDQTGDQWRVRAYRKAIATLRIHQTKVWTKEEARALPQIGDRLAAKIEEIAFTNRLRRLENVRSEPADQVLRTFMKVYGVGYAQASRWVDSGYTMLDELLEKADLTPNQKIGIEHYEDFNTRIPRNEVEKHGNIVKKYLQKIDPKFEVIIGGSFRRGSETSSDIDCIITRPDTGAAHIREIVLDQLIPKLFAKEFLVAELSAASRDDGSKWHGASQLPSSKSGTNKNPWRRLDLLLVPSDELGAALIYFTGNDIFNRSMRLLAGTKGWRLNQRGLYKDAMRGPGRVKLSDGELLEGKDEKRIFELLEVPWRPPEHRIC